MLAHFSGQMGQHFVPLGDLHFECGISHALDDGSVNRDHIFFWNGVTSFPCGPGWPCLSHTMFCSSHQRPQSTLAKAKTLNAMLDST
jgi:hypothetical protein